MFKIILFFLKMGPGTCFQFMVIVFTINNIIPLKHILCFAMIPHILM